MVKIAIAAGHFFNTPGKRSPADEREWSFNNKVVTAAIKRLNEYEGVEVIRLDDPTGKTDISLSARTNKANKAGADYLVDYHHNANTAKWGSWTGTETYCYPNSKTGQALAKAVHPAIIKSMGLRDRGIKSANFHMLRESHMPAILIEGGFMDSTIDIKKMRDDKVLERTGQALADALASYCKLKKKSTPKPAPAPNNSGSAGSGLYYVQIGAFSKKANADSLLTNAQRAGFKDAYVKREGNLHKVQIGAFSKKANADNLVAQAKRAGFNVFIAR